MDGFPVETHLNTYLIVYHYADGPMPVITDIAGGFGELDEYLQDEKTLMTDYLVKQIEVYIHHNGDFVHVETIK
jgi:hypothetical protein